MVLRRAVRVSGQRCYGAEDANLPPRSLIAGSLLPEAPGAARMVLL